MKITVHVHFVHGYEGQNVVFLHLEKMLRQENPDLNFIPHYECDYPNATQTTRQTAENVLACIMRGRGPCRNVALLIGHSMGGIVALEIYPRLDKKYRHVFLLALDSPFLGLNMNSLTFGLNSGLKFFCGLVGYPGACRYYAKALLQNHFARDTALDSTERALQRPGMTGYRIFWLRTCTHGETFVLVPGNDTPDRALYRENAGNLPYFTGSLRDNHSVILRDTRVIDFINARIIPAIRQCSEV